jgi:hypothetical protein
MSMADIIMKMPCWYVVILILFSLFYAVRGIIGEQDRFKENKWSLIEKIIYFSIQEFLFKVVITASSFLALFIANYIFSSIGSLNDIGAGTAVLLIFLIFWGITGVSGYLTLLIVTGKVPGFNK